ncbi:MAG: phytoene desaturase family protein [bacterium]
MRTVPGPTDSVVIVGAGLGGLSAALRLAGAGRSVTVVERNDRPGGRAGQLRIDGYTFDTGPTVLTMPELIDDALACVGEKLADRLDLIAVDPAYRARFADGSVIDVHTDAEAMTAEIERTCSPADVDGYRRFVAYLEQLYRAEQSSFIDRNLDSPAALVGLDGLRILRLGGLRRLGAKVGDFFPDERLRRMFSFQAMYAGLAPQEALAIYAVISYMDCVRGVWFPRGGMHAVATAMADAASEHGVVFRYGTEVERVEVTGGRARAVITTGGERIPADVVVINADLPMAYDTLLPDVRTPRSVRKLRYSPSCALLHIGGTGRDEGGLHHTIDFGRAWEGTFAEIIDRGQLMTDPSLLISNPSLTDPSLAPPGRHTHYVLFPTPNTHTGAHLDWGSEGPRYRDEMVATLQHRGLGTITEGIEVERLVTPADWEASGLAAGAPFSASHRLLQTGPFRAPTLSRQVENLVFCGANTQPGVGVPMVLLSGRLAAERVTGRTSNQVVVAGLPGRRAG